MFDPTSTKRRRADAGPEVEERVKAWVFEHVPMPEKMDLDVVTVQQVQCSDPGCSPVDTVVTAYWKSQAKPTVRGLPKAMAEVAEADVATMAPFLVPGVAAYYLDHDSASPVIEQAVLELVDVIGPAVEELPAPDRVGACRRLIQFLEGETNRLNDEQESGDDNAQGGPVASEGPGAASEDPRARASAAHAEVTAEASWTSGEGTAAAPTELLASQEQSYLT